MERQPFIDWNAAEALAALRRLPLSNQGQRLIEAVESLTRGRDTFTTLSRRKLATHSGLTVAEVRDAIDECVFGHPAGFLRCLQDERARPVQYLINWQAVFGFEPGTELEQREVHRWGRERIVEELRLREQMAGCR